MSKTIKVFICPLDWGLGHATRCIPIVRELLNQNCEVYIGGSGKSLLLLNEEFPGLTKIPLPGFRIRYARKPFFFLFLIFQMPFFMASIFREYFLLKRIQKAENFDIIISDNRYGLYNCHSKTVFITHQVHIILPAILRIFEMTAHRLIRYAISRFDECWIPDSAGSDNLTGALSHGHKKEGAFRFIGLLSRFSCLSIPSTNPERYEIVAVVSGPEPQRSKFAKILEQQLKASGKKSLLICGMPGHQFAGSQGGFSKLSHLPAREFAAVIKASSYFICRSGYSSVMDLIVLNKKAILIPTPGQTEQEYLAAYLADKGLFPFMEQKAFELESALARLDSFSFEYTPYQTPGILKREIERLLKETVRRE